MTRADIIELQTRLTELGYRPGPVDGWYGEQTQRAYQQYLDDQNPSVPSLTPAPQKPWYLSRALIGAAATIAASIIGLFGWTLDAGQLTDVITSAATLIFGLVAFIGTIQRKGSLRVQSPVIYQRRSADDSDRPTDRQLHVELQSGHRTEPRWDERDPDRAGWNG